MRQVLKIVKSSRMEIILWVKFRNHKGREVPVIWNQPHFPGRWQIGRGETSFVHIRCLVERQMWIGTGTVKGRATVSSLTISVSSSFPFAQIWWWFLLFSVQHCKQIMRSTFQRLSVSNEICRLRVGAHILAHTGHPLRTAQYVQSLLS